MFYAFVLVPNQRQSAYLPNTSESEKYRNLSPGRTGGPEVGAGQRAFTAFDESIQAKCHSLTSANKPTSPNPTERFRTDSQNTPVTVAGNKNRLRTLPSTQREETLMGEVCVCVWGGGGDTASLWVVLPPPPSRYGELHHAPCNKTEIQP